ncbi:metabotropic glutamate receptor 3-like isoform X2 [Hydractinia symbiolongicarpus]|nr:metabotropic glutamate receptor 3-like isoform X2 [Hydractinia symbiolongicarpus]
MYCAIYSYLSIAFVPMILTQVLPNRTTRKSITSTPFLKDNDNNIASTDKPPRIIHGRGTFVISGLFPITEPSSEINVQSGIMMAIAMKYALERSSSFYGYNVNHDILDAVGDYKVREQVLNTFIQGKQFLVGPYSSETTYISNILASTFMLQSISYGGTYSDFYNNDISHKYMVRSIQSDVYRIHAVLDVVKELQWNYVSVVSSFNYNGEREAINFVSKLSMIDACLANQFDLPKNPTEKEFVQIVKGLHMDRRVKAVVLFTSKQDSRYFFQTLARLNMEGLFFILCVYGCTNYVEVIKDIEETTVGVLSLDVHNPEVIGFKEYFLSQKVSHESPEYFKNYWETLFECHLNKTHNLGLYSKNCTKNETLTETDYYPNTPIHTVVNAVSAIIKTLKSFIEKTCNENSSSLDGTDKCPIQPSKVHRIADNITRLFNDIMSAPDGTILEQSDLVKHDSSIIQFDLHNFIKTNKTYQSLLIAEWKIKLSDEEKKTKKAVEIMATRKGELTVLHEIHLRNGSHGELKAFCSEPCKRGFQYVLDTDVSKSECCWTCHKCPDNNIFVNNTCVKCRDIEQADSNWTTCLPLPTRFIEHKKNVLPYLFTLASLIGLVFVLIVVSFFIHYNHFRLVRASGRDLCYMILVGIGLTFLSPFLFFIEPSLTVCVVREGLPGVAFLICYAPLFLKIYRIFRIFRHARKSIARPPMVSSRSLLLMSLGIVAVQILLIAVWFLSNIPEPKLKVSKNRKYVTKTCIGDTSPMLLFLNLALSVFFMLACTVLAFKTRHFPKNYNEAKYIGITLYITCVAWSIFLPAYFLIPEKDFIREYLVISICLLIGFVTIFGLFGHKIKLLIFQEELKNSLNSNLPTWYLSHSSGNGVEEKMVTDTYGNGTSETDM